MDRIQEKSLPEICTSLGTLSYQTLQGRDTLRVCAIPAAEGYTLIRYNTKRIGAPLEQIGTAADERDAREKLVAYLLIERR